MKCSFLTSSISDSLARVLHLALRMPISISVRRLVEEETFKVSTKLLTIYCNFFATPATWNFEKIKNRATVSRIISEIFLKIREHSKLQRFACDKNFLRGKHWKLSWYYDSPMPKISWYFPFITRLSSTLICSIFPKLP